MFQQSVHETQMGGKESKASSIFKASPKKRKYLRAADYFKQIDAVAGVVRYPIPETPPLPSRPYPTSTTFGRTSVTVAPKMGTRYTWNLELPSKDPHDAYPVNVTRHSLDSPHANEISYDIRLQDEVVGGGTEYEGNDALVEIPYVHIEPRNSVVVGALGCYEEVKTTESGSIQKKLVCRSDCGPKIFGLVAAKYYIREELERRLRALSPKEPDIVKTRVEHRLKNFLPETVFHKTSLSGALGILGDQRLLCAGGDQGASTSREHLKRADLIGFAGSTGEVTIEMRIPKRSCPIAYTYSDDPSDTQGFAVRCLAAGNPEKVCRDAYPMVNALDAKMEMDLLEQRYPGCKNLAIGVIEEIRNGRGVDYPTEKEVELLSVGDRDEETGNSYIPFEDEDIVAIWAEKTDRGTDRVIVRNRLQRHMLERMYGDRVKEK